MESFYHLPMALPMPPTWTEDAGLHLNAPVLRLKEPYMMFLYTVIVGGRYCFEHDLFELDVCHREPTINDSFQNNLENSVELPLPLGVRPNDSIRRFSKPPRSFLDALMDENFDDPFEDVLVDRLYFKLNHQLQSSVIAPITSKQREEDPLITFDGCFCEDTPFPKYSSVTGSGAKAAEALYDLFPDFMQFQTRCPECLLEESVWAVIQHLNDSEDCHRSREEIADWIEDTANYHGFDINFPTPENIPPEPGEDAVKNVMEDK